MDEPRRADCDLICVGAGIGGLTAAITAHELGLKPLIIEKTGKIGGVGGISGGQCWMPVNHLTGLRPSPTSHVPLVTVIWSGWRSPVRACMAPVGDRR